MLPQIRLPKPRFPRSRAPLVPLIFKVNPNELESLF